MAPETIVDALRRWAAATPDRPAYHLLGEGNQITATLSYGALDRRAQAIAAQIAGRQLPPDACALVMYPEGLDFIAAFMGCLYAGVPAVPAPFIGTLRSAHDGQRLTAIAADAGAALLLTTSAGDRASDLPLPRLITDILPQDGNTVRMPAYHRQGVAYIQYTSGSTATPKGIAVTHDNLAHTLADLHQVWSYSTDSAALTWMPHVHDFGLVEGLLRPLSGGIPCTIMSPWAFVRHPVRWLQAISRYDITHSGGATFAYDWCLRQIKSTELQELNLASWQVTVIGAEPIPPEIIERFSATFAPFGFRQEVFCPGYGLAETTLVVAAKRKDAPLVVRDISVGPYASRLTACGQTPGANRVVIVDPNTRHPCPPGEVGEIWIAGPTVASGYWRQPEATHETFHAWLADSEDGPFLRTGDLGLFDQGDLFITGRLKDMIIVRGQNIYPQDIEWALAGCHPAAEGQLAAAFGIPTENGEQIVIAQEIDPRRWPEATWDEIIQAIRRRVAERFELPIQGVVLLRRGDLPKTSSGKLQRYACRAAYLAEEWKAVATWRRLELEESQVADLASADPISRLIDIWQELLHTPVGPNDNFFALGGDSLTALRMALAVEEATGRRVPTEFFREPTVAHLVRLVSGVAGIDDSIPSDSSQRESPRSAPPPPRLTLQGLQQHIIRTGPLWRGHALSYSLGVRLQRAWLALPGLRERLFSRQIQVLRRWGELVGEPLSEEAIQCSLLANTWREWRNHVLTAPLGASPWVTMLGNPALWQPQPKSPGTIFLVMHTPLSRVFLQGLAAGGSKVLEVRNESGGWDTRPQDRALTLHRAYAALRCGETVVIAGDGGKGGQGVLMPFYGGQRLFRQGAAELAVQTGAWLIPVFCMIAPNGHVTIEVSSPLVGEDGTEESRATTLTRTYAEMLVARWPQFCPFWEWRNMEVWLDRLERGRV